MRLFARLDATVGDRLGKESGLDADWQFHKFDF